MVNKMISKKFLSVILVILTIALCISIKSFQSKGKVSDPDDVVKNFLELMEKGEYSKIIDEGIISWVPFDPLNREGNVGMDLSKAEELGLGKISSTPNEMRNSQSQLLKDQAEVLKYLFGNDAFSKVTFTKERHEGTLGTVWVDTQTGKQITPDEAEKINISFYNKLFKENGFTDVEIESAFNIDKLNGKKNNVSDERIQKLMKIYNDNINNVPVKLTELKTEGYVYHLSFGLSESNLDLHNFRIRVEYRNGRWVTLCGIEMDLPEERNTGN